MGTKNTYQQTLLRACVIAGSEAALARRLGVPVRAVETWLVYDLPMPTKVFLRAVDIVENVEQAQTLMEESQALRAQSQALLDRIRKSREQRR